MLRDSDQSSSINIVYGHYYHYSQNLAGSNFSTCAKKVSTEFSKFWFPEGKMSPASRRWFRSCISPETNCDTPEGVLQGHGVAHMPWQGVISSCPWQRESSPQGQEDSSGKTQIWKTSGATRAWDQEPARCGARPRLTTHRQGPQLLSHPPCADLSQHPAPSSLLKDCLHFT